MNLQAYIKKYYRGIQADFARASGVQPQQVTQWIDKGFIVVRGKLYSPRRDLPAVEDFTCESCGGSRCSPWECTAVDDVREEQADKRK